MRRTARLRPPLPLLLALSLAAGCAAPRGSRSLVAEAPPPEPEAVEPAGAEAVSTAAVQEAIHRSEVEFAAGLQALRDQRDPEEARRRFDASLLALVRVDLAVAGAPELREAYRRRLEEIEGLEETMEQEESVPEEGEPGTPADHLGEVATELTAEEEERELGRVRSAGVAYDIPMEVNEKVLAFLDLYQGRWREPFGAAFRRSGRYLPMIRRILAEEGLPQDLAYMAHVESGYKPHALSRVKAYGMWQFMAATGRTYGLHRTHWVDERADPEKATRAAARYLKFLHEMFGDWHLAMAAYNAGEHKVARAIQATGSRDFWAIARTRYLRTETKNFVPAILAAAMIHKAPETYGFDPADREPPQEFDWVRIDGQVDLEIVADAAGTSSSTLRGLNPELRRNVTPPDDGYGLRVPAGVGSLAQARIDAIPPEDRLRHAVHVVRRGDTLSLLAQRYGTSVSAIQSANGIRNPRALRVGAELTIPLSDSAGERPAARAEVRHDPVTGVPYHTVRRGESPYTIARAHRVPLDDLLAWNGLSRRSVIRPGDRLALQAGGTRQAAPPQAAAPGQTYVVRRGDTLSSIAWRHRVRVEDLFAWNGLGPRSVIYPGQRLTVSPAVAAARGGPGSAMVYVVRRGDTLYDISRAHAVDLADLCRWNGLSTRDVIRAGDRLTIYQQ